MTHENSSRSYQEHKLSGKSSSFRLMVFELIRDSGILGMTDREVMQKLDVTDPNNIRPEITRMKHDGLVQENGKTKCHVTGKMVRTVGWTGKDYFEKGNKTRVSKNTDLFGYEKIEGGT